MRLINNLAPLLRGCFCLAVATGGASSCDDSDCNTWSEPQAIDLGVTADLHAVTPITRIGGDVRPFWVVGAGGTVVDVGEDIVVHHPVTTDLHDVAFRGDYVYAVGDAGVVVRARQTGAPMWEVIDVGATTALWRLVPLGGQMLVLGDDALLIHDLVADTWSSPPRPPGGWGELRAFVHGDADSLYVVVGRQGQAWTTSELSGPWSPMDMGTKEDLLASITLDKLVFGTHGTILQREDGGWRPAALTEKVDFVATAPHNFLLGSDGRLFQWSEQQGLSTTATLEHRANSLTVHVDAEDRTAIVVGPEGRASELHFRGRECGGP